MEYVQKSEFFGYCRESINLESGIAIQKEAIEKYCAAYNITIKKWFIDNDYSAYKYRPGFDKMWKSLDNCDGIIVNDMTRFGRSDSELLTNFNEMKDRGKRLILIKENIDTNNPDIDFFMKILALFADREGKNIAERLKAGRAYAAIHGTKSGKAMHRPRKNIDWKKFDEMDDKGVSVPNIAKMLSISKSKLYNAINERDKQK